MHIRNRQLLVRFGRTTFGFHVLWLLIVPLAWWSLAVLWIELTLPTSDMLLVWLAALCAGLLGALSLAAHVWAHYIAARLLHAPLPDITPLEVFGDAAQAWPPAQAAWKEWLIALAGPIMSLVLAGVSLFVWNVQIDPILSAVVLFAQFFNLVITVVNLAPAWPFDGGRLVRAVWWGVLRQPARGERVAWWLGHALALLLVLWGAWLIALGARFSLETGGATIGMAVLLFVALRVHGHPRAAPAPEEAHRGVLARAAAILAVLVLLLAPLSMLPLVEGMYAPGPALSVEPMVTVDAAHRHPYDGTFLLTTVSLQTPIIAAQWLEAQVSPLVTLVPPEQIVPPDMTPQEQVARDNRMLEESEATAIVTALQKAGYKATLSSQAVEVIALAAESKAHGLLEPGDQIVAVNGVLVTSTPELLAQLAKLDPQSTASLAVQRGGERHDIAVPLLPPAEPGGPPRIGIYIQSAGFKVDLPFPVEITPQKIGGGPSAGLMFTLTIYNMLTPGDLTGGHHIAGTGTISLEGSVGPIGGVAQKVAGAEQAGAEYFLSPPENYEAARRAARTIKVVRIATLDEALAFLRSLPPES
ncbi:MAG TPA: site-2 protease family protein [Roseiflexaceae bacterium]|nr:site-2 protease family protein [Roseiflexaceae bacterium]